MGLLVAAILAVGAMAGFGQDPCADAEAIIKLGDQFRAEFPDKTLAGRKKASATGKSFLEKYGSCESAKDLADYLKTQIPRIDENIKKIEEAEAKAALLKRFDTALGSKNWDEVYAAGKEILQKYPDEFRTAELVLGSIGLDETAKSPRITKYNDETLRFARQAIADLEAGKEFKVLNKEGVKVDSFGLNPFSYKSKEDALGWMNYTIGYIYFYDKKDKKQGLSYLYKATQLASDTKNNPIVYESIGSYYFDEVRKLAAEVDALAKQQADTDTPEVAKEKVDAIKAKVALVNGTAEAALDAYARAYSLAKADAKSPKAYNDNLLKIQQDLYNVRFGKMDGFDTFVSNLIKKPLPNPLNPVTPISDPDPVVTTTTTGVGSGVGAATGTGVGSPNGASAGKPNGTSLGTPSGASTGGAKPAATPAKTAGPIKPKK